MTNRYRPEVADIPADGDSLIRELTAGPTNRLDDGRRQSEARLSLRDYAAFFETIGTVILGRITYEQVRSLGDWPYAGKRGLVLSSTPLAGLPEGVEQGSDSVEFLVSELPRKSSGDIWIVGAPAPSARFSILGLSTRWRSLSCLSYWGVEFPCSAMSTVNCPCG